MYKIKTDFNGNVFSIVDIKNKVCIPLDSANTDYQQYLKWVSQGNEPLPPDPIQEPEPLTAQQKLQASGLTVEELKELLGL